MGDSLRVHIELSYVHFEFTSNALESISISLRLHSTSASHPSLYPFHFDSPFDVILILRARHLTSPTRHNNNNNNNQDHDEMIPISTSRTLSHEHLEVWKYQHINIFCFFETKVTFVIICHLLMSLANVFLCLSLPPPSHLLPSPQHRPPHSTPPPHNDNDKDNKRKFEPPVDIFGGLQRARLKMGRARMGNLEVQTVSEAIGFDSQPSNFEPADNTDKANKEAEEHKEDKQDIDQKDKAAKANTQLHQSKLSRFFAHSTSSTNEHSNNC